MKSLKKLFAVAAFPVIVGIASCACGKEDNGGKYVFPSDGKDTVSVGPKPCFIWIDAAGNFPDFANSEANIERDLKKAADAGFTHIIVDVRPTDGDVLFKSDHCDQVKWQSAWQGGEYKRIERTATFDYLQAFIDKGHALGLKVYAGFNTFVSGKRSPLGNMGVAFRDKELAAESTILNLDKGLTSIMDSGEREIFFNPASAKAQNYIISLLEDLAAYGKTGLDGIILDRGRFRGIQSDFSETTREQFEKYVGKTMKAWPQDVAPVGFKDQVHSANTEYYLKWLEFRVKVIYDFMAKARAAVKAVDSGVDFGCYVGGWYAMYTENGVNWASKKYDPSKVSGFEWFASDKYKDYGYAGLMDLLIIGAYAKPVVVYGDAEWTMQGFCSLAKDKVRGDCPVYGGPDVGNWDLENQYDQDFENQAIVNSVKACADACDGYFLFDMIHLKMADQWKYAKEGISLLNGNKTNK